MVYFIVGFMGSGKSTFGKKLASAISLPFYDLDDEIEKETGLTIAAYFDGFGEDSFRKQERKTLHRVYENGPSVIACGGGTPCYFDNMNWMHNYGMVIYLEGNPAFLAKRLKSGKSKRPLIANVADEDLEALISQKLKEREVYYKKADIIIPALRASLNAVLKTI